MYSPVWLIHFRFSKRETATVCNISRQLIHHWLNRRERQHRNSSLALLIRVGVRACVRSLWLLSWHRARLSIITTPSSTEKKITTQEHCITYFLLYIKRFELRNPCITQICMERTVGKKKKKKIVLNKLLNCSLLVSVTPSIKVQDTALTQKNWSQQPNSGCFGSSFSSIESDHDKWELQKKVSSVSNIKQIKSCCFL